jgi:hypothetical protein
MKAMIAASFSLRRLKWLVNEMRDAGAYQRRDGCSATKREKRPPAAAD